VVNKPTHEINGQAVVVNETMEAPTLGYCFAQAFVKVGGTILYPGCGAGGGMKGGLLAGRNAIAFDIRQSQVRHCKDW
jgi:tRNA G10  N-methylase Trm11